MLAALLLLPILELAVLIQVGHLIGAGLTLLGVLAGVVLGVLVIRRAGASAWRRTRQRLEQGLTPSREAADATLILAAGVLLAFPGFISDVAALLLLLPPTRPVMRRPLERVLMRVAVAAPGSYGPGGYGLGGDVVRGEVLPPDAEDHR